MIDKSQIRKLALEKRNSLSEAERNSKSAEIKRQLEALELFQKAGNILCYYSHNSEVETLSLMGEWMGKKNFYLPRLTSEDSFLALPVSSLDQLEKNIFGIPEPPMPAKGESTAAKLDLIIIPGVAFDRDGNRIGMGKGFYDRFLNTQKEVPKIALAYSEQVLDQVPKEPYDETIDFIITENEVIRC